MTLTEELANRAKDTSGGAGNKDTDQRTADDPINGTEEGGGDREALDGETDEEIVGGGVSVAVPVELFDLPGNALAQVLSFDTYGLTKHTWRNLAMNEYLTYVLYL